MQYQTFTNTVGNTYPIAFLAPKLDADLMRAEYLDNVPFDPQDVIAYKLFIDGKKTKVSLQKEYYDELLPILEELGTKYILVTDSEYFKTLTGVKKSEAYLGYVLDNTYPADMAGKFKVLFIPNYRQTFYDPQRTRARIKQSLDALWNHSSNAYEDPGQNLIKFADYPSDVLSIKAWLDKLRQMGKPLTCDIEAFSLKHHEAGLGTIGFAWNKHEGISFPVDLLSNKNDARIVRKALAEFFIMFDQKIIFHNISYDAMVLIYQLYMDHLIDTAGLLGGLEIMLRNFDDTKLITYLATNSCAGNKLGLKDQAQEFAGNYAVEEIKDITAIPLPQLLEYNLVDCLSTWYVYEKHWDTLVRDDQLEVYEELFKPAVIDIIQMQLTGMPLDMDEIKKAKVILEVDRDDSLARLRQHPLVRGFESMLNEEWVEWKNSTLKNKRVTLQDANEVFNPNSNPQMIRLFYEICDLPVLDRTDSKQPATGSKTLNKLKAETEDKSILALIDAVLDFKAVDKIYGTFLPPMLNSVQGPDGCYYLFGNFNLGGTVSGRLSSSKPNLQNLPSSGSKYSKLIKDCFRPPKGHLMIGLDFASLEDRISALTTKDPNKLKVYEDGYDGHSLRAFSYFREEMPDIEDTLESINSIAERYPDQRQKSKGPTFLLTYGGTHMGMIAQFGFPKTVALQIEARYHELYRVSDEWVQSKLDEASKTGYITAAFGLRVRTPLLQQVIRGTSATPYEAEREGRTAGNALGQSWCLLNSRASVEFMRIVRQSRFSNVIRPIAHIHDAQYFIIPDDIEVLMFVNEHLVKAVQWQEHPDIAHPTVKLGGEVSVFHPSWAHEAVIPNSANKNEILSTIQKHLVKLNEKGIAA